MRPCRPRIVAKGCQLALAPAVMLQRLFPGEPVTVLAQVQSGALLQNQFCFEIVFK